MGILRHLPLAGRLAAGLALLAAGLAPGAASAQERVVFLVDQTEFYDQVDRRRFLEGAVTLYNRLQPHDEIVIFEMTNEPGSLAPVFERAIPGCTEKEKASEGIFTEECSGIRMKQKMAGMRDDFRDTIVALANNQERLKDRDVKKSQIMRTLIAVLQEFDGKRIDTLVIFSDMIENNEHWNMYSITRKDVDRLLRQAVARLPTPGGLSESRVVVYGLGRRLGQNLLEQRKRREKRLEWERKGKEMTEDDDLSVDLSLNYETILAIEEFWKGFLTTFGKASVGRITIQQNYPKTDEQ